MTLSAVLAVGKRRKEVGDLGVGERKRAAQPCGNATADITVRPFAKAPLRLHKAQKSLVQPRKETSA